MGRSRWSRLPGAPQPDSHWLAFVKEPNELFIAQLIPLTSLLAESAPLLCCQLLRHH
jgi:hypothetical protein